MRDLGFVSISTSQRDAAESAEDSVMKQQAAAFKVAAAQADQGNAAAFRV